MATVESDGDRAVVGEGNFHVGCEYAGFDGLGGEAFEFGHDGLVEGVSFFGWRGIVEGGAVALASAGNEGELADGEDVAVDVGESGVHASFVVFEDTHASDFSGNPSNVIDRILFMDTDENEESFFDRGVNLAAYCDRGLADALDDCFQKI